MKKMISVAVALVVILAMSTAAFATDASATLESLTSQTIDVTGTYQAGNEASTVYSVDIAWGSMAFTYTAAYSGAWNTDTHEYDGYQDAAWSCESGGNKIAITNHSNTPVIASLLFTATESTVSGTFDESTITLDSAVGTAFADAPSQMAYLTMSGELSEDFAGGSIGKITVSLSDASATE